MKERFLTYLKPKVPADTAEPQLIWRDEEKKNFVGEVPRWKASMIKEGTASSSQYSPLPND